MRRILRQFVLFGLGLSLIALATTGCEPEFEDDICDTDEDCFVDETCENNRCVVADNECGGAEVLDGSVGDPCGPCDLDQLECAADGESLVCDGETPCPDQNLVTTIPTDVAATTATFNGRIERFPHSAQWSEIGFCWADHEAPDLDDNCEALENVPEETGDFSLDADGLLPGTEQYVRAYAIDDADDVEYGNELDFLTEAPAPQGLEAESSPEAVLLSWDESPNALGYEILADGDSLVDLTGADTTSYDDDTAPAGTVSAPTSAEASTDRSDGIELTWDPSTPMNGATVEYEVIALYPDAESAPSDAAEGSRTGVEPTGYELYIGDDTPDEEDWEFLGNSTQYLDEDAPEASVEPGTISASNGEYGGFVLLRFDDDPSFESVDVSYRLRATYGEDDESAGPPTDAFEGSRDGGDFEYQWYRSAGDSDQDFSAISGATTAEYEDTDAPSGGEIRYYYATVTGTSADSATTNTDSGYISTVGNVDSLAVSNITTDSADLSAQVVDAGSPQADEHGFCYATELDPSYPDDNCIELGTPDEASPAMNTNIDGLQPGTLYYVRAFVHSNTLGTVYSSAETFNTAAPAPTAVETSGTVDAVTVSWQSVTGATGYRIIDGTDAELAELNDPSQTSYVDNSAPAGTVSAPNLSASNDDTTGIEVTWTDADELPGDTVEYRVVALFPDTESDPSESASGNRNAPSVTGYELTIAGEDDWFDVSDNLYFDDSAPQGTVMAGSATASDGDFDDHVLLEVTNQSVMDAAVRSYEIRATYGVDQFGAISGPEQGQRAVGDLQYQWYRSASDTDADYAPISGANSATHQDFDAPQDGSIRYYYAALSADGAEGADTNSDSGFVATSPAVPPENLNASTTETDVVDLSWDAVTDADEYIVYRDTIEIGTTSNTNFTDSDPDAAALPDAPADLAATDDGLTSVTITWTEVVADRGENDHQYTVSAVVNNEESTPSDPADGYVVAPNVVGYEITWDGGTTWNPTDGVDTHTHDSATAPSIEIGAPTASDDSTEHVALDIEDIAGTTTAFDVEAAPEDYLVRAIDDADRRGETADTSGQRATEPLVAHWEYYDEVDEAWTHLVDIADLNDPAHLDTEIGAGESRSYRVVSEIGSTNDTETIAGDVTGTRLSE